MPNNLEARDNEEEEGEILEAVLNRAALGEETATDNFHETKQNVYQPTALLAEMKITESTAQFMEQNYPNFWKDSLSFPGLSTQAPILQKRKTKGGC